MKLELAPFYAKTPTKRYNILSKDLLSHGPVMSNSHKIGKLQGNQGCPYLSSDSHWSYDQGFSTSEEPHQLSFVSLTVAIPPQMLPWIIPFLLA